MMDDNRIYMIGVLEDMAADLDDQIRAEETRTGITDTADARYSARARSARWRRDNLRWSIAQLKRQLAPSRRVRAA